MFDPIVVKHGRYTLKEVTTKRGEYCKVYEGRYVVGTYCSIRDAMYHRCEWDESYEAPVREGKSVTINCREKGIRSLGELFAIIDRQPV